MRYSYRTLKYKEFGETEDEIEKFLKYLNDRRGEIISIIPKGERFITVFFRI